MQQILLQYFIWFKNYNCHWNEKNIFLSEHVTKLQFCRLKNNSSDISILHIFSYYLHI